MAILLFALGSFVVGLLLYLPFLLWFRRKRRRGESVGAEVRYTRSGYLFVFAMLATFFGGLAVRHLAPESWFASPLRGPNGTARWGICVFAVFSVLEMVLRRADVWLQKREPSKEVSSRSESNAGSWLRRRWKIGAVRGVAVFIRGSFPLGGMVVACFANAGPLESVSYCFAFAVLVLVHELGHLAAASALGLKVFAINISGLGGSCVTQVPRGVRDTFVLFSGGLAAQAVLLAFTLVAVAILGQPVSPVGQSVFVTFTVVNLVIAAISLVPGKIDDDQPSDGAVLWELLLHVVHGKPYPLARQHAASSVFSPDTRLTTMAEMVPPGFQVGIEILNDDMTPMEFVIDVLKRHLKFDHESAMAVMARIHTQGGLLLPLIDRAHAEEVASNIMRDALEKGYSLVCRAAEVTST